ncbi:hypothetical protein GF312_03940 [Candidatus Poribacteria bacterium]|nr:hypothetical protein [Candidatus Poribacteria bacterium]
MGVSDRKPVICWMESEHDDLITILNDVNNILPQNENEKFQYLMADYWNKQGIFQEYSKGIANLYQEDCINGCAFGKLAEVRWREIGSKLRLVLISNANINISESCWILKEPDIDRCKSWSIRSVILWGTRYTDKYGWIEARIPRPLIYPKNIKEVKSKTSDSDIDYIRLFFVEYRDERGRIVIQRRRCMVIYR